ncbi:MAG: hypothetical protein LC804_27085 [Acidobacteria bacterium]|nr:hypothetical protein [Acidobacteriota bacterium]
MTGATFDCGFGVIFLVDREAAARAAVFRLAVLDFDALRFVVFRPLDFGLLADRFVPARLRADAVLAADGFPVDFLDVRFAIYALLLQETRSSGAHRFQTIYEPRDS